MFLNILEFKVENKQKISLGKTFLKMLFQICEKLTFVSTKLLLEKVKKLKKKPKNKKTWMHSQSLADSEDKTSGFTNLRLDYQNSFF